VLNPKSEIQSPRSSILPVIDLKGGVVVRGVAGRRNEYLPVESCFASDARPATVARGLVQRYSFRQVYVADLDAIAGAEPNWQAFREIAAAPLRLLLDVGVADTQRAKQLAAGGGLGKALAGLIVGLESVRRGDHLPGIVRAIGDVRAIFSIDLMEGRPLNSAAMWRERSPQQIADVAVSAGFRRLIALDLAAVGVDDGPRAVAICHSIRRAHPDIELISGGGVRQVADLCAFDDAGCNAVLVASALHAGRISPADVARRNDP